MSPTSVEQTSSKEVELDSQKEAGVNKQQRKSPMKSKPSQAIGIKGQASIRSELVQPPRIIDSKEIEEQSQNLSSFKQNEVTLAQAPSEHFSISPTSIAAEK